MAPKRACLRLSRRPLVADLVSLEISAICHARISTGIARAFIRYRAAQLSEVPAESHAVVEAGVRTVRRRQPHLRMPEVRLCRHHGHTDRPHDLRRAGLARQRVEATELGRTRLGFLARPDQIFLICDLLNGGSPSGFDLCRLSDIRALGWRPPVGPEGRGGRPDDGPAPCRTCCEKRQRTGLNRELSCAGSVLEKPSSGTSKTRRSTARATSPTRFSSSSRAR